MSNSISILFLGASGTVTGSKYLVKAYGKSILIDCGLFQGLKTLRLENWKRLPTDVSEIDMVLLTHGHLDHVGYLPCLLKAGFEGNIYCSEPSREIASIILKDSAKLQEEEADRANSYGYSKHKPAVPLYTLQDAERTLTRFSTKPTDEWIVVTEEIRYRFRYAGHIIGACFIELELGGKTFVFSGDIGRVSDPLLHVPQKPKKADVLFIESTYGDRLHPADDPSDVLQGIIEETIAKNGRVIIPSFAVERTQLLIYLLWKMRAGGKLGSVPLYMDSPMADRVMNVFLKYLSWHKMDAETCEEMFKQVKVIKTMQESQAVVAQNQAGIIIAGSGMATGGRVLNYFAKYIGDPSATILLVGYQANGTRGRSLLDGEKSIKFFGKDFEVRARIAYLQGLSAHADQEGLIDWMSEIENEPSKIFVVHGEKMASQALADKIEEVYSWKSDLPPLYSTYQLD
jgi:metallo-beta-lactamase family protein